jgi:hypothetical protein
VGRVARVRSWHPLADEIKAGSEIFTTLWLPKPPMLESRFAWVHWGGFNWLRTSTREEEIISS